MEIKIDRGKWDAADDVLHSLYKSGLLDDEKEQAIKHLRQVIGDLSDALNNEPVTIIWSDEHDPDDEFAW